MKCVGMKQVKKAIAEEEVSKVYIGKDAEPAIVQELVVACKDKGIEVILIETMNELGRMAGIEIQAATAAE